MPEESECIVCGTETDNFSDEVGAYICSKECLVRRMDQLALECQQQDWLEMS